MVENFIKLVFYVLVGSSVDCSSDICSVTGIGRGYFFWHLIGYSKDIIGIVASRKSISMRNKSNVF